MGYRGVNGYDRTKQLLRTVGKVGAGSKPRMGLNDIAWVGVGE